MKPLVAELVKQVKGTFEEKREYSIRNRIHWYLKERMKNSEHKFNYMTVPAALRELEKIELLRQPDHSYRLDHAVTKTQKEILKAFNMTARNITEQAAAISDDLQGMTTREES